MTIDDLLEIIQKLQTTVVALETRAYYLEMNNSGRGGE